jgi:hypothetical protein
MTTARIKSKKATLNGVTAEWEDWSASHPEAKKPVLYQLEAQNIRTGWFARSPWIAETKGAIGSIDFLPEPYSLSVRVRYYDDQGHRHDIEPSDPEDFVEFAPLARGMSQKQPIKINKKNIAIVMVILLMVTLAFLVYRTVTKQQRDLDEAKAAEQARRAESNRLAHAEANLPVILPRTNTGENASSAPSAGTNTTIPPTAPLAANTNAGATNISLIIPRGSMNILSEGHVVIDQSVNNHGVVSNVATVDDLLKLREQMKSDLRASIPAHTNSTKGDLYFKTTVVGDGPYGAPKYSLDEVSLATKDAVYASVGVSRGEKKTLPVPDNCWLSSVRNLAAAKSEGLRELIVYINGIPLDEFKSGHANDKHETITLWNTGTEDITAGLWWKRHHDTSTTP